MARSRPWQPPSVQGGRGPHNQGLKREKEPARKICTLLGPCQGDTAAHPKAQGQRICREGSGVVG